MTAYSFQFHEYRDFTFSGGAGAASQGTDVASTFTLSSALPVTASIDDDDPAFQDGFLDSAPPPAKRPAATGAQVLLAPLTLGGVAYPAGTRIEIEFAVSTSSSQGVGLVFYHVRLAGASVGIAGPQGQDVVPGVAYTVTGSRDGMLDPLGDFPAGGPADLPWNTLACFAGGTLIDTPDGLRPIDDLGPGDLVTTLDNGSQPLRWVGTRRVSAFEMLQRPDFRPVRFETGILDNTRPLLVSPQHRMLLSDWRAQVYFGEDQVLIAAKALVNGTTIRQVLPEAGVTYFHLLFDRHEVILADGALSESFHPGETGLDALDSEQRREIEALFPGLALQMRRAAFPIVRNAEARALRLPG